MSNDRINVGIIGVHPDKGWASTAHIPALQQLPQYRIAAVSHNRLDVAQAAAAKYGVEHALGSTDELVAHPDVDLVVVAVKVLEHRDLVTRAIEAGKAVFSEWPLGTDLAEATALRDLAAAKGVRTAIGLQTRAIPAFAYVRDLVRDGYIGTPLSATMIGSGIVWGETLSVGFAYTLDPNSGAAMLNVPFAHSIDGLLHALDSRFETVAPLLATARPTIRIEETGAELPMTVPDQVMVAGVLANGAALSAHFRGGLSRGTNFHVEINGTLGDLIITAPVGYVGIGDFQLRGARLDETLHDLAIPEQYGATRFEPGPAQSVALAYERLASDMLKGTALSPGFGDAVALHTLIDSIARGSAPTAA